MVRMDSPEATTWTMGLSTTEARMSIAGADVIAVSRSLATYMPCDLLALTSTVLVATSRVTSRQ